MMSRKKNLNPQGDVVLRKAIQRVTNAKFLGVTLDQHLDWKDHKSLISIVPQKISKSCVIMSRIQNTLDIKTKKISNYSLIHPNLTCRINVWSTTFGQIKKPHVQPKRSVRTFFATAQQPHSRNIFIVSNNFCLWINWLIKKRVYLLTRQTMARTYWTTSSIMVTLGMNPT